MIIANAQTEDPIKPKNAVLACVMSIICVGAGQLYNDEVPKGVMMFGAAIVSGFIFGVAAWFLVIPLICYAAYDAYSAAEETNRGAQAQTLLKQEAETEAAEVEAKTTSAREFVDGIRKLHNLASNGLLTEQEFETRKHKAILVLTEFPPREEIDDFLTALIPLIKGQALAASDIAEIKTLIL